MTEPTRQPSPSKLWWLYFGALVVFGVLGLIVFLAELSSGRYPPKQIALAVAATGLNLLGLLGLWCYLRSRPLWAEVVWRFVFLLIVGQLTFSALQLYTVARSGGAGQEQTVAWLGLASVAIGLPLVFALWRYAFRSEELWRREGR